MAICVETTLVQGRNASFLLVFVDTASRSGYQMYGGLLALI